MNCLRGLKNTVETGYILGKKKVKFFLEMANYFDILISVLFVLWAFLDCISTICGGWYGA